MGSDAGNPSVGFGFCCRSFQIHFGNIASCVKIIVAFSLSIGYNKNKQAFAFSTIRHCVMDQMRDGSALETTKSRMK